MKVSNGAGGTAIVLGLLATTAAACSGPTTPTVASLGATTSTTAAPGSGGPASGDTMAQAEKFAQCIRSHGVPSWPDPISMPGGGFGFRIDGNKLGASQSQVSSAQNACKKYAPNHGVAKSLTPAQQQAFLNWAACIRAHGLPQFSDPTFSGGGVRISVSAGVGNPETGPSPVFQAAQKACASKLPAGFAGIGG